MAKGQLDVQIQFRRFGLVTGPYGQEQEWADHGDPVWASRDDLRDAERWRAGEVSAQIMARFVVRCSTLVASITPADRLVHDGQVFNIVGVKTLGRRRTREITATARSD